MPLILPGPIRGYPPVMNIGLMGGLGLMVGTVGVCIHLIALSFASLAWELVGITRGLRTFKDFYSSKFDF